MTNKRGRIFRKIIDFSEKIIIKYSKVANFQNTPEIMDMSFCSKSEPPQRPLAKTKKKKKKNL